MRIFQWKVQNYYGPDRWTGWKLMPMILSAHTPSNDWALFDICSNGGMAVDSVLGMRLLRQRSRIKSEHQTSTNSDAQRDNEQHEQDNQTYSDKTTHRQTTPCDYYTMLHYCIQQWEEISIIQGHIDFKFSR